MKIYVGQKVKVFNDSEWSKTGDVGDNLIYWQDAIIDKLRYDPRPLADVTFIKTGMSSHGHFVDGIKSL